MVFEKKHNQSQGPRKRKSDSREKVNAKKVPRKKRKPKDHGEPRTVSKSQRKDEMVLIDKNGHKVVRTYDGKFKKGEAQNPAGQPKITFLEQLKKAMNGEYCQKYEKTIAEHVIERVFENDTVLNQFMKKIPQQLFDELFGVDSPDKITFEIINYAKKKKTPKIEITGDDDVVITIAPEEKSDSESDGTEE